MFSPNSADLPLSVSLCFVFSRISYLSCLLPILRVYLDGVALSVPSIRS